jgi:group I intron endonuclease
MDSFGIVYQLTNSANGKVYVGQTTTTLKRRIYEHRRGSKMLISLAMTKYGFESFTAEILFEASSQPELDEHEALWISKLNSIAPHGYNLTTGGYGGKRTLQTRLLQSAMNSGPNGIWYGKKRPDHALRMSGSGNPFWGRKHPPEIMERIQSALRGRPSPFLGKTLSAEARRKISESRKGKPTTLGMKFGPKSDELKRRTAETLKSQWKSMGADERQRRVFPLLISNAAIHAAATPKYLEIKARYLAGGVTQKQLAEEYGCSRPFISWIIHNQ